MDYFKSKVFRGKIESIDGEITVVSIDGEIGGSWYGIEEERLGYVPAKSFVGELQRVATPKIELHINSPGGDVFDGLKIYNALRLLSAQKEITCYVDGVAASIASIFPLACTRAIMPKASFLMIHNPWTIAFGNARELRASADELDKIASTMLDIYTRGDDSRRDEFRKIMDGVEGADGTWLTAAEALELGLVDEVEESIKAAACAGIDRYKNLPETVAKLHAAAGKRGLEKSLKNLGYSAEEAKAITAGRATVKREAERKSFDWSIVGAGLSAGEAGK